MLRLHSTAVLRGRLWRTCTNAPYAEVDSETHNICPSDLDTESEMFKNNRRSMEQKIQKLRQEVDSVLRGGGQKLTDPGSPFLELSQLAAHQVYSNDFVPSAGIITGIGRVHGRLVAIVANDATVKGGTYYPLTVKKHLRLQDIAEKCGLPCVYLVDSGGANLPRQAEVFPDRFHFGRIFYNQARLSAGGHPQVAVVMGSCTAGGAYVPAMADETVIVRGNGTIFLGGPALVKAATGEEVTAQELGGAVLHTSTSGVADHLAENESHAFAIARSIIAQTPMPIPSETTFRKEEPIYDPTELNGCVPANPQTPFDVRSIIARILDGSRFHEFKREYGDTLVSGFGRLYGQTVGIVANNGVLFSQAALKGAHFVQLCGQRDIPLIFLQNVTGFMIGQTYEAGGIAKDGAKMVMAVSNVHVPRLTVIIGGSFGAGNYGMCGRAFDPTFLFMWPNARISVMGGEQAADVLTAVHQNNQPGKGAAVKEWPESERDAFKQQIRRQYDQEGSAFYSTARLWDDGIIEPKDTRWVLGLALGTAMNKFKVGRSQYGVFRM